MGRKTKKVQEPEKTEPGSNQLQVTPANAPLLTVKFLELILKEITAIKEKVGLTNG